MCRSFHRWNIVIPQLTSRTVAILLGRIGVRITRRIDQGRSAIGESTEPSPIQPSAFVWRCLWQRAPRKRGRDATPYPARLLRSATTAAATPEAVAKPSKTVTASFQGSATAGQATASGEPYNPNDLTAASRNLPIGSTVRVTNPETGRSVKVRINDRGPFVHGRSLDLSKSAAEKIGITHKGVARVKVTPVNSHPVSGEPESPSPVSTPTSVSNHANLSP